MLGTSHSLQLQVERIATLLGAACLGKLHASPQQESRSSSPGTQAQSRHSHLLVSEDIYLVSGQLSVGPGCCSSRALAGPFSQLKTAKLVFSWTVV